MIRASTVSAARMLCEAERAGDRKETVISLLHNVEVTESTPEISDETEYSFYTSVCNMY